jgi:hypothetical protein
MKSQMVILQDNARFNGAIRADNQTSLRRTIAFFAGEQPIIWRGGKQFVVGKDRKLHEVTPWSK